MVLIEGGYVLTDLEPQLSLSNLLYNQKMLTDSEPELVLSSAKIVQAVSE